MLNINTKTRGLIQTSCTILTILYLHLGTQFIFVIHNNTLYKTFYLVAFNCTAFFVYAYFMMTACHKGYVDDGRADEYLLTKMMHFKKYCYRCRTHRPERSHHCSKCERCIKKMDHHCFWVGRCINNDNLAHFVRFLFFASICIVELCIYLSYVTIHDIRSVKPAIGGKIRIGFELLTIAYALFILFIVSSFFNAHLKSVLRNITYIEKETQSNLMRCGRTPEKNPYDRGIWNNFTEVMGKPYFLFLFGETADGLAFKKTYPIDCWPPVGCTVDDFKNGRVSDIHHV